MKKILIIASICLAGLLLAGCQKDVPEQNILKYGGKTYNIDHAMAMINESAGEVHIDFDIISTSTHGFPRFLKGCVGKTVQLGKVVSGVEYSIGINGEPQVDTMLHDGELDSNDFESGKMTLKEVKEGYRLTIDATLNGGRGPLFIDLYAPIEERF